MGMKRSLTTSYHPQTNGQTEIMNQYLEISLRAYIGPDWNDWHKSLDALALSYNTSPHTATGFSPAYLLRGYHPITGSTLIQNQDSIDRPGDKGAGEKENQDRESCKDTDYHEGTNILHEKSLQMVEQFETERHRAQEALLLGQTFQRRAYNKGRLSFEFNEGDQVVINAHSLRLMKKEKGRGQKLLMRYDGPFEILQKVSPVAYHIRLPSSYGIHPVINIAHLEKYEPSPPEFGSRPIKQLN
jgi:hypothetical protein